MKKVLLLAKGSWKLNMIFTCAVNAWNDWNCTGTNRAVFVFWLQSYMYNQTKHKLDSVGWIFSRINYVIMIDS